MLQQENETPENHEQHCFFFLDGLLERTIVARLGSVNFISQPNGRGTN